MVIGAVSESLLGLALRAQVVANRFRLNLTQFVETASVSDLANAIHRQFDVLFRIVIKVLLELYQAFLNRTELSQR